MTEVRLDTQPRLAPLGIIAFGVMTLLGVVYAGQNWLVGGPYGSMTWPDNLGLSMVQWWGWALMAPAILALAVRRPIQPSSLTRDLLIYAGLCVAAVLLHLSVVAVTERGFGRVDPAEPLAVTVMNLAKKRAGLNLLTFWLLVLLGHVVAYHARWRRERRPEQMLQGPATAGRLAVRGRGGDIVLIDAASVLRVEAAGNYAILHLDDSRHMIRATLDDLLKQLGEAFARVNRSALVNLQEVSALGDRSTQGDLTLVMRDGASVRLTRTYRQAVIARLPQPR